MDKEKWIKVGLEIADHLEEIFREKLTDPAEVRRILKEIFED